MRWLIAVFLVAGLLLAGSEGEWFPLPNLVGMVLIGGAAYLAERRKYQRRYGR
jgi:hypothetical protein